MVTQRRSRNRALGILVVAFLGVSVIRFRRAESPGFVPSAFGDQRSGRGLLLTRHASSKADEALRQRWQQGLDTAFFDIDASLEERLAGIRDIMLSPGAVAGSMRDAVLQIADKGLGTGPVGALDTIFPQGTLVRSDLEGMLALFRQVPEVMGDLYRSGAVSIPEDSADTEENLARIRRRLAKLLTPEGMVGAADSAFDGLRKTPKMMKEPEFEVLDKFDGYEVRRYRRFTLATRTSDGYSPSDGLSAANPLSAMTVHLTNNADMNMTMYTPILIRYNFREPEPITVSFMVLPGTQVAEDDVELVQVPERVFAIRRFPGIATSDEVRRQYELLRDTLEETNIYEPYQKDMFSVLQYNPPYTIPWRRRNEIAIEVTYNAANAAIDRRLRSRQSS
mmetsp:Transcript_4761/g.13871  ORF Transcript_4761/g.13871 Transcript_4761/m.13871 type:complete len:393 (+) Transcript_4761:78-1256(+)